MNALHRSLLSDIRLILANPTQENRSMERHTPLPAHCKFYSVLGVFHHRRNPSPVFDHRESSTSRQLLFRCHDSRYGRRSTDFSNSQINVLNDDSLESAYSWMIIANNSLYTAIDFISQLILVSVLHIQLFLD